MSIVIAQKTQKFFLKTYLLLEFCLRYTIRSMKSQVKKTFTNMTGNIGKVTTYILLKQIFLYIPNNVEIKIQIVPHITVYNAK